MAELFDESHYFICTNGLSPARIQTNIQTVVKRKDDNFYLTENSLICLKNKDFKCRFIAVICALIAALIVLLACNPAGWVILAALAAAMAGAAVGSIFAGMLCGHKAAIARSWVAKKLFTKIEGQVMVLNSPSTHLTCKVLGGQIYYAPNITCELDATILFCMNVGFAGLEGFMYAFALRGAGLLVTKPMAFVSNMATNFIRSLSPTGILTRVGFGLISREHADLSSRVEGGTEKERSDAFWNAAAFDAKAVQRLAEFDYRDEETGEFKVWDVIRDVSIPMSLGGIPGGARGQDATQVDALRAWENNGAQYRKIINGAKNFRTNLRGRSRGIGSHEQGFFDEALRRLLEEDAQALRGDDNGPVVARAKDMKTGRVSERYINIDQIPDDLHPLLRERVNRILQERANNHERHYSKPGTHAEVLAVDELLKAREAAGEVVTERTLNDIVTDQYWLREDLSKPNNGINPAPTCGNCTEILKGTTSQAGSNQ